MEQRDFLNPCFSEKTLPQVPKTFGFMYWLETLRLLIVNKLYTHTRP